MVVTMKYSIAVCWTLVLLAAVFLEGIIGKGGRGGARGAARGSARGTTRRSKALPRYSSSGTALRVAAAAAAGGAASAAVAAGIRLAGADSPENTNVPYGNGTAKGSYNYQAWTSGAQPWHFVHLPAYYFCLALLPRIV